MAMQGVCKFYLQDKCTYGKNCRFYHPPRNQLQSSLRGQTASTYFDNGRNWDRRGNNQFSSFRGGGGNYRGNNSWQQQSNGLYGGQMGRGSSWQNSGRGNNWQTSGRGNDWQRGNNWQTGGRGNNWQTRGNNWQTGGRGNDWQRGNNWQTRGNNWQTGGRGNNWQTRGNNWQTGGRGNNWQTSGRGSSWTDTSWLDGRSDDNMEIENLHSLNISEITEIIRRDMISFINNCVWPLSSYTPVPAVCCNLPELQEYSMEEIRHSAYSSGQLQTYLGILKPILEKQQFLFQQYQSITNSDASQLMTNYRALSDTPTSTSNPFTPVKDLFGVKGTKQQQQPLTIPPATFQEPSSTSCTTTETTSLTQAELEIYTSEQFTFGKIPETAPPPNLCH